MKHLFSLLCVVVLALPVSRVAAQATLATGRKSLITDENPTRQSRKSSPTDMARMQRRMSMNPDEVKRDQQLEILEARSGVTSNTSLSRGSAAARQYDSRSGGFALKKFKDSRAGTLRQKRGQSRPAPGIDPKGKPLKHKHKKKFLFF